MSKSKSNLKNTINELLFIALIPLVAFSMMLITVYDPFTGFFNLKQKSDQRNISELDTMNISEVKGASSEIEIHLEDTQL